MTVLVSTVMLLQSQIHGNINLSNFTFASTHHNLINDKMTQTTLLLYETLCIREGIFKFVKSKMFCQGHKLTTLLLI